MMKNYEDGSNEYKLGRLGRRQTPYTMKSWTPEQVADFKLGFADRAKLQRRRQRKDTVGSILSWTFGIPAAILGVAAYFIIRAIIVALPVIIVLLFVWLIFF